MDHYITRATILPEIIENIMKEYNMTDNEAFEAFYTSATGASFDDDETGLYGQSPNYIFGLFVEEQNYKKSNR